MSDRKRINITLRPAEYDQVSAITKRLGLGNPSQAVLAMVRLFVKMIENPKQTAESIDYEAEDQEYITGMFSELADFEPTPEAGHVPCRSFHRSVDSVTNKTQPHRRQKAKTTTS